MLQFFQNYFNMQNLIILYSSNSNNMITITTICKYSAVWSNKIILIQYKIVVLVYYEYQLVLQMLNHKKSRKF